MWCPMIIDWHIGDVIQKLRNQKGLNQTQLAQKVGVNKATIVRIEGGDSKVSRGTYLKIAAVLGTSLADLETEAARLQPKED
jgi:transcriptional regulator with XRE-family HTH domain